MPSGMVNVTQVLNILDDEAVHECLQGILPEFQEVCGVDQWEGYYIDKKSIDVVLDRLNKDVDGSSISSLQGPLLPNAFSENDPKSFVIIASREMVGLIFLARFGKTVQWNRKAQSVESAIIECEQHGLSIASKALQTYTPTDLDWTSHYKNADIMSLFDEGECPSEATEHNSFYDPHESFGPKMRKRKGRDVPILPQAKKPTEITAGAVKTEAWVKEVTADIRPTRFSRK
jgi:hypothetical protein